MNDFKEIGLKPGLIEAVKNAGFENGSDIQKKFLPTAIKGQDCIVQGKSGTGKTSACVLAVLQQLPETDDGQVKALFLCHTRAICYSIAAEMRRLAKSMYKVRVATFYGGVPVKEDLKTLKELRPNIVIGTPGRVLQLMKDSALCPAELMHLIIDNCDHFLTNISLRRDIQEIYKMLPKDRQVLLVAVTLPRELRPLCKKFTRNVQEIYMEDVDLVHHNLNHYFLNVDHTGKNKVLEDVLDDISFKQVIIFVNSAEACQELSKHLNSQCFPVKAIHHLLPQVERDFRLQLFINFLSRILVTTDALSQVQVGHNNNLVINYEMPKTTEALLHRVNKAVSSASNPGVAITFVSSEADKKMLHSFQERFMTHVHHFPSANIVCEKLKSPPFAR